MTSRAELLNRSRRAQPSEAEQSEARAILNECRAYDDMFATDGWGFLQDKLRLYEQASVLMLEKNAKSLDEVMTHRSRLQLIRELLGLETENGERAIAARNALNEQEDVDGV